MSCKTPSNNTIYMAGSISKTITATAIFQLCEKHLLNIDDPLSKYVHFEFNNPYYPATNITIKMLLNHTSSIKDSKVSFIAPVLDTFDSFPMLFLKLLTFNKLELLNEKFWRQDVPPGTEFHYANVGYGVLQYLIEIISGNSFEEYCKENIFEPLEMNNTSFHLRDFKLNQQAMPYFWINKSQYYMRLFHYDVPLLGAGSLRTTVEDLSHFLIAHMNNGTYKNIRILNESNINLMHTPTIAILDKNISYFYSSYCLGWMICNDTNYSGHGGDTFGSHAMMVMNKANNTGLIYFWNSSEMSDRIWFNKVQSIKKVEGELKKVISLYT
jgi:CubicO group peptidase (beta-lactamase class C family)